MWMSRAGFLKYLLLGGLALHSGARVPGENPLTVEEVKTFNQGLIDAVNQGDYDAFDGIYADGTKLRFVVREGAMTVTNTILAVENLEMAKLNRKYVEVYQLTETSLAIEIAEDGKSAVLLGEAFQNTKYRNGPGRTDTLRTYGVLVRAGEDGIQVTESITWIHPEPLQ